MDAPSLRRSMRLSITEGALATSMGTLLSGVFLTGFALSLGASRLQIGILAALPPLATTAQIAGSYLLERQVNRKRLCVGSLAGSRIVWLPLLLVPVWLSVFGANAMVWPLMLVVGISSTFSAVGGVAWLSWIRDLIPDRERISFLGRRNQFDTALAMILSLGGAAFVDWWQNSGGHSINGYIIVLGVGMACGLGGMFLLYKIPDHGKAEKQTHCFAALLGAPLLEPNFRRLIWFYLAWNVAVNIAAPFFTIYMLQKLQLPLWFVTLMYTLGSLAALFTNPFWVRLSQRFGVRPVIFVATFAEAFFPLFWLFVTPGATWMLPCIFLIGVFNAPLATGANNLIFKIAPARSASPFMAIFYAIVSPVAGLAAIAGGYLADRPAVGDQSLGLEMLGPLKLLFLASFLARIGSLLLLRGVNEPGACTVANMLRAVLCPGAALVVSSEDVALPITLSDDSGKSSTD
jgi:hypothetical protein